uniref:Uncharacterized protein n=1 Tax=Monopterus albus TaxID=43700 RepID=A0A3Q3JGH9_MONAL
MGDLNAKIGKDNLGKELIMGTQNLGKMNENGELFTDFCAFNDLVISGIKTSTKKPGFHQMTDLPTTANMLLPLLQKVWREGRVPADWKKGHMVKPPKKGDLGSCKNWRGIMLLSVPSKVLTRIILDRLKDAVEEKLRPEQAGFRKDKSCTDQIVTLRIIIE